MISDTSRRADLLTGKTSLLHVTLEINLRLEVRKKQWHEWLKLKRLTRN